jgi:hypothetical protein
MNTYPIGFNAPVPHGRVGNENYFLDVCRQLKSSAHLIGSDPNLATKTYDVCEGQSKIIYRSIGNGDNNYWRTEGPNANYIHPNQFADGLVALDDSRIILHASNEPNPGKNPELVSQCLNWHSDVIDRVCGHHGRELVVLNAAAGGGGMIEIDYLFGSDIWHNFLQAVNTYRDKCYIGLHEYNPIIMPMTYETIQSGYKNRYAAQPDKWLHFLDGDDPSLNYKELIIPWLSLFGRHHLIEHKAIDMFNHSLPIILTEYGTDRLQNIEQQTDIYNYFANLLDYPDGNYTAPHGFYANKKVWEWYWPQWDVSQSLFEQLKWTYQNYPMDWVKGICLFMWSYDEEFSPRGFNLAPDTALHGMMIHDSNQYRGVDVPDNEEPPTNNEEVDLLDYMRGDGHIYELKYQFPGLGEGVTHVRTERTDSPRFFHVKGIVGWPSQWEELWYDDQYIWRGTDTSPNMEEIYQISEDAPLLSGGLYGAEWIYRYPKVGDKLFIESYVTFRDESTGDPVSSKPAYLFEHWIEFHALHKTKRFAEGITLNDVVELRGYLNNGKEFERYFYAKGYGLVGWEDPTKGWKSYITKTSIPGELNRKQIPWLKLPETVRQSPPIQEEVMSFDLSDERWQYAIFNVKEGFQFWNVRPEPNLDQQWIDRIAYGIPSHGMILEEEREGDWYPIRLAELDDASFDDRSLFNVSGWIRIKPDDGVGYEIYTPPVEEEPKKFWYQPPPEMSYPDETLLAFADHMEWMAGLYRQLVRLKNGDIDQIVIQNGSESEKGDP